MGSFRIGLLKVIDDLGVAAGRAGYVFDLVRAELMLAAARPEQWRELTARVYNRNALYRREDYNAQLYDWERRAIDSFFPQPPARLLVGAAGAGREMYCLAHRGYTVAGFDPADELVQLAARHVDPAQLLCCEVAGYEELIAGLPAIEQHAPYDGIVLGFGSISHLARPHTCAALLRRLRTLSESGPVLLSWSPRWPRPDQLRVRALLAYLGLPVRPASDLYTPLEGFLRHYAVEEISALARSAGYRVATCNEHQSYPNAVLLP